MNKKQPPKKRVRKKTGPRQPRTQRNDALKTQIALLSRKLSETDEPLTPMERSYAALILEAVVGQGLPGWFPRTDHRPIESAFDHGQIALARAWVEKYNSALKWKQFKHVIRDVLGVAQDALLTVPARYLEEAPSRLAEWEATPEGARAIPMLRAAIDALRK